ncbi:MerR family transcriptional regulator [Phaeobacter italicus]|uniref:MerR family transcriptional regulator n=1 Tax=Phaeobacter italicus TaxID=481446 RepID=UPI001CD5A10C|nr:MerR family transcriptional regulator [Phaeobacter italicus]MCA0856639.1 MerR family transcriptional regulator [Phaeobacter italicus]
MSKSPDAFRTISEVAEWLGIQAHVLRFWESKFTQIKPVKRAGGRRYYRPADVDLLGSIKVLLHDQGMAIKDVQALLREHGAAHVASLADPDAPSAAQGSAAASDVEPIENASADPVQGDVIEATVEATFEPVEPPAAPAPTPSAPAAAPGAWAEPASPAPATAAPTPAPAPQAMPPAAEAPQAAPTPVQADPAQPVQTQPVQPQPVQTQPQMQAQPQVQPTVQPSAAPPAAASDAAEQAQPTATPTPTAPTYATPVQDGVTQAAAPAQAQAQAPADPAPSYQPQAPSALAHGATAPAAAGIGDDSPAPQAPAAAVSTPAAPGPAPIVPTASPSVSVDPVQAAVSETGDIHPPEPQSETALPQTSFGAAAGSSGTVPAYDGAPTASQPAQSTLFGESTEAPAPSPAAPVSAAPSSAEPVATPPAQPATSNGAGEHLQPDLLGDLPQIEEPADLIEAADSLPSDLPPVAEVDRLTPAPEDVEAATVEAPSAPQSPLPQDTAPATPFADAADETPATNVTDAPTFAADMPAQTAPQEALATDIFAAETAVDAPADLAETAQPVDEASDFTQAPAMVPDPGANPAEVEIDLADHTDAPVFDAEADLDDNPLAVAGALDQEPADVAPLDVAEDTAAALVDDLGDDLGGHADPLAEPLAEAEDLPDLAALDGVDVDQALHDAPYESEEPTPEDAPLDMFDAPQEPEAEFAADMEAAAEQMAAEDSALDDSAAEDLLAVDPVETVGAETETVAPDDAVHDAAQDLTAPMEQVAEISQPIAGAEDAASPAEEPAQELELGDSADVTPDAVAFELDLTEAGAEQQDAEAETQALVVTPASEDVAEGEVRAEVEAPAEEIPAEDMSADMAAEPAGASDDAPLSDGVSIDLTDDLKGDLQDDLKVDLQDDMSAPLADEGAASEAETGEVAVDAAETDAGDALADGLGEELVAEPESDALADMAPLAEPVSDAEPEAIAAEPAPQEQTLDATFADGAAEESMDSQGDQSQAQPLRARVVIVPDLRDGVPEPRAAVLSHLAGLERVPAHLQEEIADCLRALRG